MQFSLKTSDKITQSGAKSTKSTKSIKAKSTAKPSIEVQADHQMLGAELIAAPKVTKATKAKKVIKHQSVEQDVDQVDALMAGPDVEIRDDRVYGQGVQIQTRPGARVELPELDFTFDNQLLGETVGADEDTVVAGFPWGWLLFGGLLAAGLAAYLLKKEEEDPEVSSFKSTKVITDDQGSVTGELVDGSTTDDTKPTISGKGETPSSTVTVYVDGKSVGTTKVDTAGKWSLEPKDPLTEGKHTIATTITEPGKTVSPKSPEVTITVDTSGPAASKDLDLQDNVGKTQGQIAVNATIAEVSAVEHTDDTTPTYSGDFEATDVASVKIFDNGTLIGTAPVDANGKWTFTPSTALSEGNHIFTHQGVDKVGNGGTVSTGWAFIIDTTGPTASTGLNLQDDVGDTRGQIAQHETIAQVLKSEYTDDALPTYSGKTSSSDATQMVIFDNGTAIATVPVAADGSWTYTPSFPLANGNHIFTNQGVDASGNSGATSTPWAFVIDTIGAAPAAPAITEVLDDKANKTGVLQKNDHTNDETLVISGTGTPATTVTVYSNELAVGTALVDASGKWNLPATKDLGIDGLKNITAKATNGNGLESISTGIFPVVLDRTNPVASDNWTLNDNVGTITGVVAEGSTIDDTTPSLIGQLSSTEAGSTVSVYMDNKLIGTAVAGADGKWTLTSPALADGKHAATIEVTDSSGNTSGKSTAKNFTINSVGAVSVEYAVDNVEAHLGNITDGGVTNDKTPELVGRAPANSTVTVTDPAGKQVTAVADANGVWKAQMGEQPDGVQNYKVTSVAPGGVAGEAKFALNIDATAPTKATPIVTDDVGSIQGTVVKTSTIDDATPTIQGEKAQSGDTVSIYDNGQIIGSTTVKSDGTWSFSAPKPGLTEGNHDFQVTMTDPAGNTSAKSDSYPFVIDTTPPGTPTGLDLQDNFGTKQGQIDKNTTIADVAKTENTDDKTPTYSGVSTGASTVVIYDKGVQIATVLADANGKWTFTPATDLSGNEHIFTSKGIDAAGNEGQVSAPWAFVIAEGDGVAPAAPAITQVLDDKLNQTGVLQKNDHTNDETLVISGTATPGTTVTVYSNGVAVGTAAVDAKGDWNLPATKDLGEDGLKNLTAKATNSQNLVSPETGIFPIVLDRTNPAASDNWTLNDNVGTITGVIKEGSTIDDTTPTLIGQLPTAEAGSTVSVYMDNKLIGTAVAGSDGKWTLTSPALVDGTHAAHIQIKDSSGNTSTMSADKSFVINSNGAVSVEYAVDNVEAKTGNVNDGGVTNDKTPQLVGKAPANSTVTVTDPAGKQVTAVADANGVWKAQMGEQPDGIQNYKVTSVAPGGVTGEAKFALNIDATAPAKATPIVTDDVGTIQGTVVKNSTIDDTTPTIQGEKAQTGDTVTVYDNGSVIGTTTVSSNGTWSFSAPKPGLLEGQHNFQVTMTDPAGNTSEKSESYPFIIDVTPPGKPTGLDLQDNVGETMGQVAVNATISDVAPKEYTDDKTPTYSGVSTGASTVVIFDNGVKIATVLADANGKWTYTPSGDLVGKNHIFTSQGIDAAGNEGQVSDPWAFVLDQVVTPPVTITQVTDNKAEITGTLQKGALTNDETLLVEGKFAPSTSGAEYIVHVFVDGKEVGTTKTDANGNWSFTTPDLGADGKKVITASGYDPVVEKTTAATDPFIVILDRTAPKTGTMSGHR